jgi:WD40 repeat protein
MVCANTICKFYSSVNIIYGEQIPFLFKKIFHFRKTLKYRRELFAKKYGHSEWVTSVAHLRDGRVLSAGMDSKLCLWDRSVVRCDDLVGAHQGSITKVLVDEHNISLSASYDTTIAVWDLTSKSAVNVLKGAHRDAVLDFVWHNSLVVSGDKNG